MRFGALSAVALLSLSVACGGGDDNGDGDKDKKICDANAKVDCGSVPAADVNGATFVVGLADATCASDGKSWDTSACTPKGGAEFTSCYDPDDQCLPSLTCVETGTFLAFCLKSCNGGAACEGNTACVEWNASNSFCLPIVPTGNECYANNTCGTAGDTCIVTAIDQGNSAYGACSRECDATTFGSQGTCAATETCVSNNGKDFVCPTDVDCGTDEPECDPLAANTCAAGYKCTRLTATSSKCAKETGICVGKVLPLFGDATELELLTENDFCYAPLEPTGETNAYLGEIFVENAACGVKGVTGGNAAESECVRVPDTQTGAGFCVAFCGEENGTETQCGTGYVCARPTNLEDAFFIDFQRTGTTRVTCTGPTDTTCAAGNTCYNTAATGAAATYFCVQPSKMCMRE